MKISEMAQVKINLDTSLPEDYYKVLRPPTISDMLQQLQYIQDNCNTYIALVDLTTMSWEGIKLLPAAVEQDDGSFSMEHTYPETEGINWIRVVLWYGKGF